MIDLKKPSINMRWIDKYKSILLKSRTYKILRWDPKDRVLWEGKKQEGVDIVQSSLFLNLLWKSCLYKIIINLFKEREIK